MLERIRSIPTGGLGGVRISAIYSVGTYVLQDYIKEFIRKHRDARIDIEYQKAGRIYDDILRNRADLGLMAFPARRKGIQILPMRTEEMLLVCHPSHPLARKSRLEMRHLQGQNFIAFDPEAPTRAALDRILRWHGIKVNVAMELDNIETIKSAVMTRGGVSILPEAAVRNEARIGKLAVRRFADAHITRPLCVLVKKDRRYNKAVELFLEHLRGS